MKIVAISDCHGRYKGLTIPECDLLISCGDYSFTGALHEVRDFHKWLNKQPATHIISLQGNHEREVQNNFQISKQTALEKCPRAHFMEEGPLEIEGFKIWLSAYTPTFFNWGYMKDRGEEIKEHWDRIPEDTQILITHGPPYTILDTVRHQHPAGHYVESYQGCVDLHARVFELPKLEHHFFGHMHEAHGHKIIANKHFWNTAVCDDQCRLKYEPTVIEIKKPQ